MDSLVRWDPFGEGQSGSFRRLESFVPRFDVKETHESYIIHADLPGVKEDALDVSLTGNVLNVSGTREEEKKHEDEKYFAMERSYGEFNRSFAVPESAEPASIKANLKDGVLTIELKKKPDLQAKKIAISKGETGKA
jgi:HSP20 family protein